MEPAVPDAPDPHATFLRKCADMLDEAPPEHVPYVLAGIIEKLAGMLRAELTSED